MAEFRFQPEFSLNAIRRSTDTLDVTWDFESGEKTSNGISPKGATVAMTDSNQILLPGHTPDELFLTVAGNLVRHLGVQMYAGRPVPAIAELISNAWDADATEVDVHLPLDEGWDPANDNQIIKVSDNGNGMTWDMVRYAYLNVGRDRRKTEGKDRSPTGRLLQGRKGVGKLAGFGIADTLEIQTIHEADAPSLDERVLIWFRLDLSDITKIESGPAPVKVIFAGPVSKGPAEARKSTGTTVTLRHLHERRARNSDRFHGSIARRFLLLQNFQVRINDQDLQEDDITFQVRKPNDDWATEEVAGCGPVSYWIGFTERPRQQNQGESNGVLVYTRGKISQEETFFEISGGTTGQHGLRYLVGKVRAEWLDAGMDSPDHIATPRDSIAWKALRARPSGIGDNVSSKRAWRNGRSFGHLFESGTSGRSIPEFGTASKIWHRRIRKPPSSSWRSSSRLRWNLRNFTTFFPGFWTRLRMRHCEAFFRSSETPTCGPSRA